MAVNHIVIYSGGMDSFTLLHLIRHSEILTTHVEQQTLAALSFNYGQRHKKELHYAARVCADLKIPHKLIKLDVLHTLARGSALTGDLPVPHGHYASDNMKQTVVPGRNMVMLALAAAYAESSLGPTDRAIIYYGAHSGDHTIYPDCRPAFVLPMMQAVAASSDKRVDLYAPFMDIDKTGILRRGLAMGLDYANSWSCYAGEHRPCGLCGACQERAESFALLGIADPALGEQPDDHAYDYAQQEIERD